ncbi:hypothetical protein [Haloarchaeobius baliensis]|uniref:hypothetical protein n=1 Tax=Haloarchaeobius baliensis TaxID=1670458 RepID=UPI003F881937
MRRRTYLTATTLSLTSLAGCTGLLGGGEDSDVGDDPEATLRAFLTEAVEGDRDRARELIHPDGPMNETTGDGDQEQNDQDLELTIEETEIRTQENGTAMVIAEYTLSDQQGNSRTDRVEYELRTENGDWRVWDAGFPGDGAPSVAFDYTDDPAADTVTIVHAGGDILQEPERITVRVEGEPRDTLDEIIGSPIEPGDSGTISVPEDTVGELELRWDNGERSQLIGVHTYDVRA